MIRNLLNKTKYLTLTHIIHRRPNITNKSWYNNLDELYNLKTNFNNLYK